VLARRRAVHRAARGGAEAADVKHEAVRIGEGVLVSAMHLDALALGRDRMAAGGAKQALLRCGFFSARGRRPGPAPRGLLRI